MKKLFNNIKKFFVRLFRRFFPHIPPQIIIILLIIIFVLVVIKSLFILNDDGFTTNLITEIIGIIVTVGLIDYFIFKERKTKTQLIVNSVRKRINSLEFSIINNFLPKEEKYNYYNEPQSKTIRQHIIPKFKSIDILYKISFDDLYPNLADIVIEANYIQGTDPELLGHIVKARDLFEECKIGLTFFVNQTLGLLTQNPSKSIVESLETVCTIDDYLRRK